MWFKPASSMQRTRARGVKQRRSIMKNHERLAGAWMVGMVLTFGVTTTTSAQVRDDILDGFISRRSAEEDYVVVLDPDGVTVDEAESRKMRESLSGENRMFHRGTYSDGAAGQEPSG